MTAKARVRAFREAGQSLSTPTPTFHCLHREDKRTHEEDTAFLNLRLDRTKNRTVIQMSIIESSAFALSNQIVSPLM